MDSQELLKTLYAINRSGTANIGDTIFGLTRKSGRVFSKTLDLHIHETVLSAVEKAAGLTGSPPEEFLLDCLALGFIEISCMLGMVTVQNEQEMQLTQFQKSIMTN